MTQLPFYSITLFLQVFVLQHPSMEKKTKNPKVITSPLCCVSLHVKGKSIGFTIGTMFTSKSFFFFNAVSL